MSLSQSQSFEQDDGTISSLRNQVKRFLLFVSGADLTLLNTPLCPASETNKFVALGAAMCLTTVLAFFSGLIGMLQILQPGSNNAWYESPMLVIGSVFFASYWTLMIFNLQRFVISGSSHQYDSHSTWIKEVLSALPGMLISLLIGLTLATPLQIFFLKSDIDLAIAVKHQQMLATEFEMIDRRHDETVREILQNKIDFEYRRDRFKLTNVDSALMGDAINETQNTAILLQDVTQSDDSSYPGKLTCAISTVHTIEDRSYKEMVSHLNVCSANFKNKRLAVNKVMRQMMEKSMSPASKEKIDDKIFTELQMVSEDLQILEEKTKAILLSLSGAGLLERSAVSYEILPLFSWILLLSVIFIQCMPVLIKSIGIKGVYDYLLEMQNSVLLAKMGIEKHQIFDQ